MPADIWHFHDSQAAQLVISQLAQPRRASKSASRTRNRQVAAARCPASSQICASSGSSGTRGGPAAGLSADRLSADRLSADRLSADRLSADRLSADRLSADRLSADRLSGFSGGASEVSIEHVFDASMLV